LTQYVVPPPNSVGGGGGGLDETGTCLVLIWFHSKLEDLLAGNRERVCLDETSQPEFAVHLYPMWSSAADYAESKHVDVTCQVGAENCTQVLMSPEDYVQVKSSANGRVCPDDHPCRTICTFHTV
jgi:hypothetical protein